VGWEDRDWAKWNDDERRRFFGSGGGSPRSGGHGGFAPGALLAVVVSLVAVVVGQSQGINLLHLGRAHASIPIAPLYGSGIVESLTGSGKVSCTALSFDSLGQTHCTGWTDIIPGERVIPPAGMPARGTCATAEADQTSGTWICTAPAAGSVSS
jgi:hypothetical protein